MTSRLIAFAYVAIGVALSPAVAAAERLPAQVRGAWRAAGAEIHDGKDVKVAEITFREKPKVAFAKLPAPNAPFSLEVRTRHLGPADYKDLVQYQHLMRLTLNSGFQLEAKNGKVEPLPESDLQGLAALAVLPDLRRLKLENMSPTVGAYGEIAELKSLREVDVWSARLTDADLAKLGTLPELEVFETYGRDTDSPFKDVTAEGMKGLAALPRLREVRFSAFPLDDEGCRHLGGVKTLRTFTVWDTHFHGATFGDEGLKHLARATGLTQIDISIRRSRITDEGVKHLAGLKGLTRLDLRYAEVTDAGMKHLAELKTLRALDLSATAITNAGMEHLRGLTALEHLDLRGNTALTADGLKPLHDLRNLATLSIYGTKMHGTPARDAKLAELRKAIPKCEIGTTIGYTDP